LEMKFFVHELREVFPGLPVAPAMRYTDMGREIWGFPQRPARPAHRGGRRVPQRCIPLGVQIEGERYGELPVGDRCSTKIIEIQWDGSSIHIRHRLYGRFAVQIRGRDMGRFTGERGRLNVA
jgi:hypothetical protein